jgi:DNA polymerase-3 subunit delta
MAAVKAGDVERTVAQLDPRHRVVLVYGPDAGLVAERAALIASRAVSDPADPFQLVRLDGADVAADPMKLADEANTIGLFGGRRAIRVSATTRSLATAVEPLLRAPPVDSLVVLEGGDLNRGNPLRAAIERAASGLALPCYADQGRGLDQLVDQVLSAHGLRIERDARTLLLARLGADRQLSRRELEKLALYRAEGAVTAADVDAIVGDAAARDIDDVVDGAFGGNLSALDLAWSKLRQGGEDVSVLLGFALRHGLTLLNARDTLDRSGGSPASAVEGMRGLHFARKPAAEAALRRFATAQLLRAVTGLDSAVAQARRNPALADALAARALWNIARG